MAKGIPTNAIYRLGKRKERATKSITHLKSVMSDLDDGLGRVPLHHLGLFSSIQQTMEHLKKYRKSLDE